MIPSEDEAMQHTVDCDWIPSPEPAEDARVLAKWVIRLTAELETANKTIASLLSSEAS